MFLHTVIGSCRSRCRFLIVTCFVMSVAAALSLSSCYNGYEKLENKDAFFSCEMSTSSLPTIWSLLTLSGQTTHLATCYDVNNCTSPLAPDVEASRTSSRGSLSIKNIGRERAGTLQVSDGNKTVNCTLDVQSYVKVDACRIQVHNESWTAVGSCGVTNAYSALERYEYTIDENYMSMFNGRLAATLTAYVNKTDGKGYFRGNYTHTWPLRHLDGTYTYRMNAYPSNRHSRNYMGIIVIQRPVPPSLQCESSPPESVRVPCVCSTPSVGRPAGRLLWLSGDTVLAAGQYGVTELQHNVTFGESGHTLTCRLDWIHKSNVSTYIPAAAVHVDSALMLGVAVGGYVALGAVLVVVVVVVVFLWRRGMLSLKASTSDSRHRPSNDTASTERKLPEDDDEDGYTCLAMGEVASEVHRTGAAKADSGPEEIYENTEMGRPI